VNAADERRRFAELVLPHLDAAYNLARWLSGGAAEAEDVVQEALLRAYTYFGSYHGDRPRPWLLAIVRNTWFSAWNRDRAARDAAPYEDGIDVAQAWPGWQDTGEREPLGCLLRAEDVRLVHEALARLPAPLREVLVLRELEDLCYRDIAQVAAIPLGTVMSRLARARHALAAAISALRVERAGVPPTEAARRDGLAGTAGEVGNGLQ
jgi:RNA polymerase sigma-70 factor (ECF subfamily)